MSMPGDVDAEWVCLTEAGVALACERSGQSFAVRVPDVSRAFVFLPSGLVERSVPITDRFRFDAMVERRGHEIVAALSERSESLKTELHELGKLKRQAAAAPNDQIRASLLDELTRRTDPERISSAEAKKLLARRTREAEKDRSSIDGVLAVFQGNKEDIERDATVVVAIDCQVKVKAVSMFLEHAVSKAVGECLLQGFEDVDWIRSAMTVFESHQEAVTGSDGSFDEIFDELQLETASPSPR